MSRNKIPEATAIFKHCAELDAGDRRAAQMLEMLDQRSWRVGYACRGGPQLRGRGTAQRRAGFFAGQSGDFVD